MLARVRSLWSDEASALAEFAVSLPLLVVVVYGIFDFGGAFTVKEKLQNAAREGARYAASEPTNDLDAASTPVTINNIKYMVDGYLVAAGLNDCGLNGASAMASPPPNLTWTYKTSVGCPGDLVLEIQRSVAVPATIPGFPSQLNVISTNVSLSYVYAWHINNVIQLVAPGASFGPTTTITTDSTAPNMF